MKNRITITLLLAIWTQMALAWGSVGHRAIAEIAYDHLNKNAKKEITMLLGDAYLPLYANWADELKSAQDSLKPLGKIPHYINMAEDETFEMAKDHKYSIYNAYEEQLAILSNKNNSDAERGIALKLLVHFIADMHQPMHCGRPEDRGGNSVKVSWFGKSTNLHRVWDSDLIDYTNLSYSELAVFAAHYSKAPKSTLHATAPSIWLNESKLVADDIYANVGTGKFYYAYPYKYLETVYTQIEKAGIRLSEVLNAALK